MFSFRSSNTSTCLFPRASPKDSPQCGSLPQFETKKKKLDWFQCANHLSFSTKEQLWGHVVMTWSVQVLLIVLVEVIIPASLVSNHSESIKQWRTLKCKPVYFREVWWRKHITFCKTASRVHQQLNGWMSTGCCFACLLCSRWNLNNIFLNQVSEKQNMGLDKGHSPRGQKQSSTLLSSPGKRG